MLERSAPFLLFQGACVLTITLTLWAMGRFRPIKPLLLDYFLLAFAGFLGEETCIEFYHFYEYAPGWLGRLHHVPVMVPLIWPLVILSSKQVVLSLAPTLTRGPLALAVGVAVVFDATLVEALSVKAGFWRWNEMGHLNIPFIGIIGWGYYAAAAIWLLETTNERLRPWLVLVFSPIITHLLLLVSWWGLFRWVLRGDQGYLGLILYAVFSLIVSAWVISKRRQKLAVGPSVWAPRLVATSIFGIVFVVTARESLTHSLQLGLASIPYVLSLRLRSQTN